MKLLLILLGLFALFSFMMFPKKSVDTFESYKMEWGKNYDLEEESYRRMIFIENVKRIEEHNATPGITYTEGINMFTDLTTEEFIAHHTGLQVRESEGPIHTGEAAGDIDWCTKITCTVKDQGQCGSCWAFSAVGAMEGINQIKTGSYKNFAEQQLVDCSRKYGNQGCNGGWMDYAFAFAKADGMVLQTEYPYVARDQACKKPTGPFKLTGFVDIAANNCDAQIDALQKQPISVAADASRWSSYSGGIFSNCGKSLNHGITLVAYKSGNDGFWQIKNSWGTRWGEKGYMRLKLGNTCGLCAHSSYPTL